MRLTAHAAVTAAEPTARTITGRIVTFGEVGNTSAGPTRFEAGSIDYALDDVVLRLEHDRTRPVGRAVELSETDAALDGSFRVIGTRAGDDALIEAAEGLRAGFSVGVEVTGHDYVDGVLVVTAARLEEVSLVTHPALASSTVSEVAASELDEDEDDNEDVEDNPEDPASTEEDEDDNEGDTVDESTAPAVAEATAHIPARVIDAFPYGPNVNASFFRDMVDGRHNVEAAARVQKAQAMLTAAQKTADVAEVIPPGYRPDLYEGQIKYPTPVTNAFRNLGITDATPFKVPVFGSGTGLSGDHVEGTNPTDGTLAFDEVIVTPKAVSGRYTASREMLDASNPNLDAIIMGAMLEEYATDLEAYVATQIIAGATAGGGIAEATATNDLIADLIAFDDARKAPADVVLVSPTLFAVLALEEDQSGRKVNPYLGPSNATGALGTGAQSLSVVGQQVEKAWAVTTTGAIVARGSDASVFRSGVLSWRWEEKAGPANIEFAHFGYVAVAITRAAGVRKNAYTPTTPLAARSAK